MHGQVNNEDEAGEGAVVTSGIGEVRSLTIEASECRELDTERAISGLWTDFARVIMRACA